ncbi:MAG: glycyl-radical enzyme activating protein [Proteobacteria bacterium]|nr:glycyl-radical enzyme activating protein [Pseudomonadota bacterium]
MNTKPLFLDIKGNALDDGPGIRSVIFMKGCPLDCLWCHNPESKKPGPELSFDPTVCLDCGTCRETCKLGAIDKKNLFFIDRDLCSLCYACVESCPSEALSKVGQEADISMICEQVFKDLVFYQTSRGGVTISGGEPALYMDFLSDLLQALKKKGVHTLVETSGHFDFNRFEKMVLPYTDTVYVDIKFVDPSLHKKYCGISNHLILDNIRKLWALSQNKAVELRVRTPLVPGITATEENIAGLVSFLHSVGIPELFLLEYNPLWQDKLAKLGMGNPVKGDAVLGTWMDKDLLTRLKQQVRDAGIKCA